MKYINKIIKPIVTLISNIKYLLCVNMSKLNKNELEAQTMLFNRVNKIYDNIDIENIEDKMYDMDNSINDIQNDLEDKASEYQIQDIIHDTFGYSEDYVNYDDMNDIKDEIKDVKASLKNYVDTYEMLMEHLKNGGFHDELAESYRELAIHKVIEVIIGQLNKYNDVNGDDDLYNV